MPLKQAALGSNQLLNLLQKQNRVHFIDNCEVVSLDLNDVIIEAGDIIQYIYFPIEGIVSWEKKIADSPYLVITLISNEGVLFPTVMLAELHTPCRAVVQKAGFALRISVDDFMVQIARQPQLSLLLKRYIFVMYNELLQTAACNLYHVLESRLAKLLLSFQDKSQSDNLHITQELLAQMLGVRRVGVTKAAGALQDLQLISYSRGNMIIHNHHGLKTVSCLCYEANIEAYTQFLKAPNALFKDAPDVDEVLI